MFVLEIENIVMSEISVVIIYNGVFGVVGGNELINGCKVDIKLKW